MDENQRWILSFYRNSEITGALFFGRLAQYLPYEELRADITRHFADESQHARYWTDCLGALGATPLRLDDAYQDRYFEAIGIPANIMEILAITKIFEARVIRQYHQHSKVEGLEAPVLQTFEKIMADEAWHLKWVSGALENLKPRFGAEQVDARLAHYRRIDAEVYAQVLQEYDSRLAGIFKNKKE